MMETERWINEALFAPPMISHLNARKQKREAQEPNVSNWIFSRLKKFDVLRIKNM